MQNICTLPNFLSFLRLPLAVCLFCTNPAIRCVALVLAMVTDVLDGYVARRKKCVSRLGTFLDPITDKVFVVVALFVFYQEKRVGVVELCAFLSRDVSLVLFFGFLLATKGLSRYTVRAFFCGKVVTTLQFVTLIMLCLHYDVPQAQYWLIATFGAASFFELVWIYRKGATSQSGAHKTSVQ